MQLFNSTKALYYLGLVIFATTLFFQCRKNEDTLIDQPYQPVYVSGGVYGNVVNEHGGPEPDVKVSNGTNSVLTDQNGVFILQNQLLNKEGAQIKFEKAGFYTIYKSVIPIKDKLVSAKLQLVRKKLTKVISATSENIVVANGNAQITIPSNSIANATGQLYLGKVQVYAYWMNPTKEETTLEMPGNLTGRDKDGKEVALQTLGMLAVELEDLSGNPLNIAMGKFAELQFPIPSSLDAQAKSTIPLWYFDATKGGWIEEGIASRQGNIYVGQVTHFSFWNCDYPFPAVTLKGRVLDVQNNPIGNVNLEVIDNSTGQKAYGITTSDGYFEGKVPASTSFILTVGKNQCQSPFILPFSTSTSTLDLGNINTSLTTARLFGVIHDCVNSPVTDGYLQFWIGTKNQALFFPVDASGSFKENIIACTNTDLIYRAVDLSNFKQSNNSTINYQNQTEINLGVIRACDANADGFIIYVNGVRSDYLGSHQNPGTSSSLLLGFGTDYQHDSIFILFNIFAPGGVPRDYADQIFIIERGNDYEFICDGKNDCQNMNVIITQYGPLGTQIAGNFNGVMFNSIFGQNATINGEFSIERRY
jgi:hypothetical protein